MKKTLGHAILIICHVLDLLRFLKSHLLLKCLIAIFKCVYYPPEMAFALPIHLITPLLGYNLLKQSEYILFISRSAYGFRIGRLITKENRNNRMLSANSYEFFAFFSALKSQLAEARMHLHWIQWSTSIRCLVCLSLTILEFCKRHRKYN